MSIDKRAISSGVHRGLVALAATLCRCNKQKNKGPSFCPICYHRLPLEMRGALYQRSGQGYEEAYDEAVRYLEGKKTD